METYLLKVQATWQSGAESPAGKSDFYTPGSRKLSTTFESPDVESARKEAKRLLEEFKNKLPKKYEGSLHWQNEDAKVTSVIFAQIIPLES
jgi:hypothetical protein